ncbi:hypothetical protein AVEN_107996-1 [Araneus ventricosus]|uniref:CCHC-type domain-containing protein n=1 Tax=Araneus ventricosus TaxID=182803 RepID=A0A4Y2DU15_ARAVE|nr:hypothetical protein AVEN_107996-1 [Araneus ventricosus]
MWTRKQDEEADSRSTKCFSCGEWGHISTTRWLLLESGLGPTFCAETVSTAAYLCNKSPSSVINGGIPERKWSGKEVNTNHIRVFGYRTWSHACSHTTLSKFIPRQKNVFWLDIVRVSRVAICGT